MLVTFALHAVNVARAGSNTIHCVQVEFSTETTKNFMTRFEMLWQGWNAWKDDSEHTYPELNELVDRTDQVMEAAALVLADIRIAAEKGSSLALDKMRILQILKASKKALRAAQRITHMEELKTWVLPRPSRPGIHASENLTPEQARRRAQNRRADKIETRRKRPVQCCMYVAVAFAQLLYPNEMLAEYEAAIVLKSFDKDVQVDDRITYEKSQLKDHCLARLHPPTERWPKAYIRFKEEASFCPFWIRNPKKFGPPIVTNQRHPKAASIINYLNVNRINIQQNFSKGPLMDEDEDEDEEEDEEDSCTSEYG